MKKNREFWNDVAKGIEAKYGRGNPFKWEQESIEEFIIHIASDLCTKFNQDKSLIDKCGGAIGMNEVPYYSMDASTFRRLFEYEKSSGTSKRRNAFALYLGYPSALDYIHRENRDEYFRDNPNGLDSKLKEPQSSKELDPVPVILTLQDAEPAKEDEREEWMVYELAFLLHGKEPPSIQAHFHLMTREIERTKQNLHQAVVAGILTARTVTGVGGYTRFITRDGLEEYIKNQKLDRPEFLKRETRKG